MSEKYFEYIAGILFLSALLLPTIVWRWRARLQYLQNLARINILKRQQKSNRPTFFSTYIINLCCKLLYLDFNPQAKTALIYLVVGYTSKAAEYLLPRDEQLSLLLRAHFDLTDCRKHMSKHKKLWFNHRQYTVFVPLIAHLAYDRNLTTSALQYAENHPQKFKNETLLAYHSANLAHAYLYEGEMLSASHTASEALKIFQQKQYAVETAACHLLLADIYRISCVNDIAETMVNSAIKIYQTQQAPLFLAKAIVAKGMLMVFENRRQEAAELYQKALDMPITEQLRADIYNQQTLLDIIEGRLPVALKTVSEALAIHQKFNNRHSTALSLQLIAQIAYMQKQYRKTVAFAQQAGTIYNDTQNRSAYAECLYMTAAAQYKQKFYAAAEKNLRAVLELNRRYDSNFHSATAYSLLGLIYVQKGDLQRAKVLLQQSLALEQSHQRCEGLAADYFNLALIAEMTDHHDEASANWEIAAQYAQQTGDSELIELIQKKSDKRI